MCLLWYSEMDADICGRLLAHSSWKYDILFSHCGLGFIVISAHITLAIFFPTISLYCFLYPSTFPPSPIQTFESHCYYWEILIFPPSATGMSISVITSTFTGSFSFTSLSCLIFFVIHVSKPSSSASPDTYLLHISNQTMICLVVQIPEGDWFSLLLFFTVHYHWTLCLISLIWCFNVHEIIFCLFMRYAGLWVPIILWYFDIYIHIMRGLWILEFIQIFRSNTTIAITITNTVSIGNWLNMSWVPRP